jgi:glycosyltransferase involved in cell wall biosynthesis
MSEGASSIASFISVSDFYAEEMKKHIHIPDEKLSSVHIGLYPEDYEFILPSEKPGNIGYVSRMCEENGLEVLVDAFIQLKKDEAYSETKLIITGGSTGDDKNYIRVMVNHLPCGADKIIDTFLDSDAAVVKHNLFPLFFQFC